MRSTFRTIYMSVRHYFEQLENPVRVKATKEMTSATVFILTYSFINALSD